MTRKALAIVSEDGGQGEEEAGVEAEVCTVSYVPYLLYANFLHEGDRSVLGRSVWDLVKDAVLSGDEADDDDGDFERDSGEGEGPTAERYESLKRLLDGKLFLDLTVTAEDPMTGEEVELPPVRLVRWRGGGNGEKRGR